MTDPKPMDPERLAELRLCVSARQGCLPTAIISELLADRDHQEAELDKALDLAESLRYDIVAAETTGPIDLDSVEVKPAHGGGLLVTAKIDAAPPVSRPMDPARLADAREASGGMYMEEYFFELLLAHDHWQAEAEHWKRNEKGSRELREDMEMRMMLAQSEARRLESLRAKLGELVLAKSEDATYWEEKAHDALRAALKWRARSDVKGEDVEAAGVSEATAMAWALRNTYEPRGGGLRELFWAHRGMSSAMPAWMHPKRMHHDPDPVEVAGFINAAVAFGHGTPAFEVLDEMAAMEPPS